MRSNHLNRRRFGGAIIERKPPVTLCCSKKYQSNSGRGRVAYICYIAALLHGAPPIPQMGNPGLQPPIHFLGAPDLPPQTTSWTSLLFLHNTRSLPTDKETNRQTERTRNSACTNRPLTLHLTERRGLILFFKITSGNNCSHELQPRGRHARRGSNEVNQF